MAKSLFRVADKWLHLPMVVYLEIQPGCDWEPAEYDEHWPHLYVNMLGNSGVTVWLKEAKAAGFDDIASLRDAIAAAMDELS